VSRLHPASETDKFEQVKDCPTWAQAKTTLEDLSRTGLLTLKKAVKNRLIIQWEPRVFPNEAIKPQAQRDLESIRYDVTLAFRGPRERDEFLLWVNESKLLQGS
jgi:hypothetical protein